MMKIKKKTTCLSEINATDFIIQADDAEDSCWWFESRRTIPSSSSSTTTHFLSCYGHQSTKLSLVTFRYAYVRTKCNIQLLNAEKTAFLTSIELIKINGNQTVNVNTISETAMWCRKSDVYGSKKYSTGEKATRKVKCYFRI